jgi:Pyridoxamine 5'-phosphate oxidase
MTQQQAPEPLTELKLNDQIKEMVGTAYTTGKPIIVAYTDADGAPSLSYRGSAIVYSDTQMAIWARNPEGGLLKAVPANPRVTLLYRNPGPDDRAMLQFRGTAHIENDEATREKVYNNIPEGEQNADREKKGSPVIVDLLQVDGFMPGARVVMRK